MQRVCEVTELLWTPGRTQVLAKPGFSEQRTRSSARRATGRPAPAQGREASDARALGGATSQDVGSRGQTLARGRGLVRPRFSVTAGARELLIRGLYI